LERTHAKTKDKRDKIKEKKKEEKRVVMHLH
jgi:hypothetical protein